MNHLIMTIFEAFASLIMNHLIMTIFEAFASFLVALAPYLNVEALIHLHRVLHIPQLQTVAIGKFAWCDRTITKLHARLWEHVRIMTFRDHASFLGCIEHMPNLTKLSLYCRSMEHVDFSSIPKLVKLSQLRFYQNNLGNVPELPLNLTSLIYMNRLQQGTQIGRLPKTLRKLHVCFSSQLQLSKLPVVLRNLNIHNINTPVEIPSTVTRLRFGNSQTPVILPPSLQQLRFTGVYRFSFPSFPPSLVSLIICSRYGQPLPSLPASLLRFIHRGNLNGSLDEKDSHLPPGLVDLTLQICHLPIPSSVQTLDIIRELATAIPPSVKKLSLGYSLSGVVIPEGVENVTTSNLTHTWPSSVHTLTFWPRFDADLSDALPFPPGLRCLRLPFNFNRDILSLPQSVRHVHRVQDGKIHCSVLQQFNYSGNTLTRKTNKRKQYDS